MLSHHISVDVKSPHPFIYNIFFYNGCCATFQLDDVPDDVFEITCQSFNYEYRVCPHPHQPVQMENLWLHQTLRDLL